MVLKQGILLSTFPPEGMKHPEAHLNYAFDGDFDIFSHQVARNETSEEDRTLYVGFIANNPSNKKVHIQILSGASYLSQPDAPFLPVPDLCLDNEGKIFSGPGDRVNQDVMRGRRAKFLPDKISLAPGQTKLMFCLPVPVRHLQPALNGRNTLIKLRSSAPVYIASVARFIGPESKAELAPKEWLEALENFPLASPRDEAPTPLRFSGSIKYGRVAGVARGTAWNGTLTNKDIESEVADLNMTRNADKHRNNNNNNKDKDKDKDKEQDTNKNKDKPLPQDAALNRAPIAVARNLSSTVLDIAPEGKSITYPFCTVEGGTFGTGQVQSAPMIVRYHDTAYEAHGNYGVTYKIAMPLHNPFNKIMNVQILFQSSLKSEDHKEQMCFYETPPAKAFFRGSVYLSDGTKGNYWHLVEHQGSEGTKLAEISLPAGAKQDYYFEFLYPADSTPPQELCIKTLPDTAN